MAGGGGDASASASSHAPSLILAEYLLVALIIISLLLEVALHKLEKWIATRHLHLQAVLRNLYRELMVLGLVSFVFIAYEVSVHPPAETVASFEFAHVFIFLLAIIHTVVVLISVLASLSLSRRWRHMEQMDLVRYLELKEQFRRFRARRHAHHGILWRRVQWWLPDPRNLFRYWSLHETMAFHDIRFQFLYYRDLPEDFNFSGYLRKLKAVIFIDLVDAHWSLWFVFLFVVAADIVRRHVWDDSTFEAGFAIAASAALAGAAALLTWKIRRVSWALTKHPATYFNHVSKESVLEGLDSAPAKDPDATATTTATTTATHASDADDERTDTAAPAVASATRISLDRNTGTRVSFEAPRITNLVYSEPLDISAGSGLGSGLGEAAAARAGNSDLSNNGGGGGGGSSAASARAPPPSSHKRKPRRVPEPPTPTAEQLAQIAEMHSLATRAEPRRRSLDGAASAAASASATPTPTHLTPSASGAASPITPGQPRLGSDAARLDAVSEDVAFVPIGDGDGETGVIRVSTDVSRQVASNNVGRSYHYNSDQQASTPAGSGGDKSPSAAAPAGAAGTETPGRRRRSLDVRPSWDERPSMERRRSLDRQQGRRSVDGRPMGRRSIELAATLPVDELADRNNLDVGVSHIAIDVGSMGPDRLDRGMPGNAGKKSDADDAGEVSRRSMGRSSKGDYPPATQAGGPRYINASLVKHAEQKESAQRQSAGAKYPKYVTAVAPRLKRVAGTAEKLFWFGSHRFFLWCVEFVLFFSTVLLASTTSSIALAFVLADGGDQSISGLNIAAICCSFATLFYVLTRISYVMKKYTFVINNSGLVPEALALQVIHNVHQKRQLMNQMYADAHDDASASDTDAEASEAARERRRKFSRFFTSEVQTSGHIAGASEGTDEKKLRDRLLRPGLRRRRRRARAPPQDIPLVPEPNTQASAGNEAADSE